jgi:hypothetical protein
MTLALHFDGAAGHTVLVLYMLGGVVLAISAAFPGDSSGSRAARIIIGAVAFVWAGYVLLFGGWILISYYIALLPFILAGQGIVAAVKRRKAPPVAAPLLAPYAPQPSFPTTPPAPAPPSFPSQAQPGYPAQSQGQGGYPGHSPYPAQGRPAYPADPAQSGYPGQPYPSAGQPYRDPTALR